MSVNKRTLPRVLLSLGISICLVLNAPLVDAADHHGQIVFAGVPVPGARVTATHDDKKLTTITDASGVYSFPDLGDGTWTVLIEKRGFSPEKNDVVASSSPMFELKILPLSEINAKTQTPLQRTGTRSTSGASTLRARPAATAQVAAGAAPPEPPSQTDEVAQRTADGLLINGSQNNGASSPFALNPAFGNNRRTGRSMYNGNIGINVDNSVLNARQFSLTGQNTLKPSTSNLTGLVNFGGPIRIPKLLRRNGPIFTINYQWTRNQTGTVQTTLVPTAEQRAGNLSGLVNPTTGLPVQVVNPLTGTVFANNKVPVSPQAQALLSYYPLPNFSSSQYNYQIPIVNNSHSDSLQARLNKSVGRKNQFTGGFAMQSVRGDTSNLFGFLDTSRSFGFNANPSWRHTFTPRLYGTFTYTFRCQSRMSCRFWMRLPSSR